MPARIRRHRLAGLLSLGLKLELGLGLGLAASPPAQGQGVRLLAPGEEMIPRQPIPAFEVKGRDDALETVKIAVPDNKPGSLRGMIQRTAPFEIVPNGPGADLLWDPAAKTVRAGDELVASRAAEADLPAIIDTYSALRALKNRLGAKPQALRPLKPFNDGAFEVEIPGMAGRAPIAFTLTGDGTLALIYPRGADPRLIKPASMVLAISAAEAAGPAWLIVLTAGGPMDDLEQALAQIPHYRASVEVLHLIAALAPKDTRLGILNLAPKH